MVLFLLKSNHSHVAPSAMGGDPQELGRRREHAKPVCLWARGRGVMGVRCYCVAPYQFVCYTYLQYLHGESKTVIVQVLVEPL